MQRQRRISWGAFDPQVQELSSQINQEKQKDQQRDTNFPQQYQNNGCEYNGSEILVPRENTPKKVFDKNHKENIPIHEDVAPYKSILKQQKIKRISFMPYLRVQYLEKIQEIDESIKSSQNKRQSIKDWNQQQNQDFQGMKYTVNQFSASKSVQTLKHAYTPKSVIRIPQPSLINNDPDVILQELKLKLEKIPQIANIIQDHEMDSIIDTLTALMEKKQMQVEKLDDDFEQLVKTYNVENHPLENHELEDEISSEVVRQNVVKVLGYCVENIQFQGNKYQIMIHYFQMKLMLNMDIIIKDRTINSSSNINSETVYSSFMNDLYITQTQIKHIKVDSLQFFEPKVQGFHPLVCLNDLLQSQLDKSASHQTLSKMINQLPITYLELCRIKDVIDQCIPYFGTKVMYNEGKLTIYNGYRFNLSDYFKKGDNNPRDRYFVFCIISYIKCQTITSVEIYQLNGLQIEQLIKNTEQQLYNQHEFTSYFVESPKILEKIKNTWRQNQTLSDLFSILTQFQEMSLIN